MTINEINAAMDVLKNKIARAESLKSYMKKHKRKMVKESSEEEYENVIIAINDNLGNYCKEFNRLKAMYSMNQIQ